MSERHAIACEAGAKALDRLRPDNPASGLLRELATKLRSPKREPAKPLKSEWATMKDEITRKALGTLADAQLRFSDGQITGRELWCIVDGIYDTVSGLVDWDIAQLIYRARQELKEHAPQ
ncbi:hypothetical protein [Methylobacterium sp. AMS5]|uniref:hypothetical protein n=1 Tax=Methylobacterium sp. AMS5 TaxID=925818 RepID=UPI00074F9EED|nr:hypothetical protein [Methylobacterium sp. AMS5]AMB48340.1 hypothetical protein Y590_25565 [Methylobacterium sp. AMS5]